MATPEYKKSLLRVKQSFKTDCTIWFSAPYSYSEEVTLPTGMVLNLNEHDDYFEVTPVDNEAWAPFLISGTYRFDKNFRYGYSFDIKPSDIGQFCEPLTQLPDDIPEQLKLLHAIQGCLFGTAVGDSIGLPFEGLTPKRIQKFKALPLRQRFLFGRGMLSDDTEHTCMVASSLIFSQDNPEKFSRQLAWKLRWWLLALPAGIGMATLKACLKLWLFIPPRISGVYSAGNGPAMRSAILGVYAHDDEALRTELVTVNTRITHTDPKALKGAMIVAELAARNAQGKPLTPDNCLDEMAAIIRDDDELKELLVNAIESARQNQTAQDFCQQQHFSKGVSGYVYHTLPVVLQIVLRCNDDYEQAITEAVACGGDTDTVAAIIGGIVGAHVGKAGIPEDWLNNLKDWPRDKNYIRLLGEELALAKYTKQPGITLIMDFIRIGIRNTFFILWVLAHGFRRLLPPY